MGAYRNASTASASGQVSGFNDSLWGKPVYVTQTMGAGTAHVGTTANAKVFSQGDLSVEVSNSHSSFFQTNMIAGARREKTRACRLSRLRLCRGSPGRWTGGLIKAAGRLNSDERDERAGRPSLSPAWRRARA